MPGFNSIYTGAEVDEAVGRSLQTVVPVQVYSGSPTNQGVDISVIPVNPETGTKEGIYDVVYSNSADDINGSSGTSYISRIYIGDVSKVCMGTAVAELGIEGDNMYAINCDYNRPEYPAQEFHVNHKSYDFLSNSGVNTPYYIHEIWRLQKP